MSTSLIGGVVGAAVGFFAGGPTGAQIGWAIGSYVGATFAPTERVEGQRLTDLRVMGTDYGQAIPYVQGHPRIAGQIWWASDRRPIATVTESGGKGGGGGVETVSYTYDVDLLIGLTDNELAAVTRIWDNGKLIWTDSADSDSASHDASAATDRWDRLTIYLGTATQLPDPTYEAAVGTTNALAYRHRSYVFIQAMHLGPSGFIPNLTFEVSTKAGLVPGNEILLVHFNGTDGQTTATDETGTVTGGAFAFNGNAAIDDDHPLLGGQAVYFDGAGDSLGITPAGDLGTFWGLGESFTVEFMFENDGPMPEVVGNLMGFITNLSVYELACYLTRNDHPTDPDFIYCEVPALVSSIRIPHVVDSDPHWVRFSYDGTTFRFSLDGVEGDTQTGSLPDSIVTGIMLGKNPIAGQNNGFFKGWIKEIRVTQDQVRASNYIVPSAQFELEGGYDNQDEDLDDVVSRLSIRAGLAAGQFDVTGLTSITKQVRALALSQVAPTRQAIELLMSSFYFEATVSDKIYYRPRGGASVATIPYLDLGASMTGATDRDSTEEPFALKFTSEIETPAQVVISYINVDDDYQTGAEMSDRLESAIDSSVANVTMALGLTADEAKGNANTMLWDQVASNGSATIRVLANYAKCEPTDIITVTDGVGDSHRLRIVRRTDTWPLLEFEIVKDDASVLQDQGITSLDYTPSVIVEASVDTVMELIDGPILRNADDDPGFYVAAKGSSTPYPGSVILQSTDEIEYSPVATVTESAVLGDCTTTLGNWTGPNVFDEINTVTVNVGAGTLSSSTRAALIASSSVNAMMIGSEIIQFRTATLVSTGIYTLSGLLRGGRGTEWAMTGHAASERCVLLRTAGLRRIDMQINQIGDEFFYKGVTIGRRLSTATAEAFTNNAIGLKPFSPTNLRAFQDVASGDITITCSLRSRLTTRGISTLGQSIPLGEDSEAGEFDILSVGSPESVVRTLTGTITGTNTGRTMTATYTAAMQAADGLSPGSILYRAYQISETVGRGYELEKAA